MIGVTKGAAGTTKMRIRAKTYTVRRDDSEIRLIMCPVCLDIDVERTNRKAELRGDGGKSEVPV